ncbi:MAG: sodium:proton antiporter [Lachnospiraceae bacterium]|jgi:multicomponent Na+:H+ antiporter subunit F|nr:sodium:proton antiporter [Lachnospiraceae bacterium]MCX4316269.1 monovalent cation/H+ antiporter complex subunit F [Lachnospiraceae bacterium]
MSETLEQVSGYFLMAVMTVLIVMIFLAFIRAIRGPKITDRIISVNMIGSITMMAVAVLAVIQNESYLVDICLIYAMISFLAVIVLCKIYMGVYAERKKQEEQKTRLDDLEKAGSAQEKEEG